MKLDHDLGSIEAGKLADFAVLDDDPLEIDPMDLKDIGVWGTVLGGVPSQQKRSQQTVTIQTAIASNQLCEGGADRAKQ